MRTIYEVNGANGPALFESQSEAEAAIRSVPADWGRAVGAPRPTMRTLKLFATAQEWHRYAGHPDWAGREG